MVAQCVILLYIVNFNHFYSSRTSSPQGHRTNFEEFVNFFYICFIYCEFHNSWGFYYRNILYRSWILLLISSNHPPRESNSYLRQELACLVVAPWCHTTCLDGCVHVASPSWSIHRPIGDRHHGKTLSPWNEVRPTGDTHVSHDLHSGNK